MIKDLLSRATSHFSWLVMSRLLSVLVLVLFARAFAPDLFGRATLFITFLTLSSTLGSFGLGQWFQKQAVKKNAQISGLMGEMLQARAVAWLLLNSVLLGFFIFFPPWSLLLTGLFLVASMVESWLFTLHGYWLVQKKPWLTTWPQISKMLGMVGVLLLIPNPSLELVLSGYVAGGLSIGGLFLIQIWPQVVWPAFSVARAAGTLRSSMAYGVLLLTSFAYGRGDQLVIRYSIGEAALGLYAIGYRYLELVSLAPLAIAENLFHVSAKDGSVSRLEVWVMTGVMTLAGSIVGAGMFLSANLITVGVLGPAYAGATSLVQIFSFVTLLFFINSPLSTVVQSSGWVESFLPWGVGNTFLNLLLNVVLLPVFGLAAAAWLMLVTEITGLVINLYFVRKIYAKSA